MKYYLFCFLLYFLNCTHTSATIRSSEPDSSIRVSDYKQSHQFFLEKYGKDDTTRALINYFFRERKIALYETVLPAAAAGVSALLLNAADKLPSNNKQGGGYLFLLVGIPLGVIILEAPFYFIDGQIRWLRFSRKGLLVFLTNYNSGNSLSHRITRRKVFKLELEKLK